MSATIVVVGSLNMDLVVRVPRHPRLGETILGNQFQTFPGGKGANQAVAAARLGGTVRMIGRVGSDGFGASLLTAVSTDGVDTQFILSDPDTATGVALITVDENGENSIVVASGANARVTPEQIRQSQSAFENASVLLLQLECPLPAILEAVQIAVEQEIKVILNPAPAQPLPTDLLRKVDYLIPNQTELGLLAYPDQPNHPDTLQPAVQLMQEMGIKNLLVTLGSDGVLVIDRQHTVHLPAYTVPVVDSVAAGDAFVGAFAVALSEGKPVLEAARWGNAAGALSVTRHGAQPSLPTRAELTQFLSEVTP